MPQVRLVNNITLKEIIADERIIAIEANILIVLMDSPCDIYTLISVVKSKNAESYKFVPDNNFYKAIGHLFQLGYVVYG